MSDVSNPIAAITPSKATAKNAIHFVLWVLLSLLFLMALWFLVFRVRYSWVKIKALVAAEAKKYADPAKAEKMLISGVNSIIASPGLMRQVFKYSKATGAPVEQVLVDNATAMAKEYGYIKAATVETPTPAQS